MDFQSLLKIISPKLFGFDDCIGIFDDTVVVKNGERAFGAETQFSDTLIPFYCIATDFNSGEPVVISDGSLARAVRISSGIPIVFKPVEWDDKLLIDGGLSNPLPVDVAIQEGADIIIAVGFESPMQPSMDSVSHFISQTFAILVNQLLSTLFGYYNMTYHSEIIAIVPEFKEPISVNDVEKVPFIIEQGVKETRKQIDYLKRLIKDA